MSATFTPGQAVKVVNPVSMTEFALLDMEFTVERILPSGKVVVGDNWGTHPVSPESLAVLPTENVPWVNMTAEAKRRFGSRARVGYATIPFDQVRFRKVGYVNWKATGYPVLIPR